MSKKKLELITVARACDWHIPYHDPVVIEVAFKLLKVLKPSVIVIDEVIDWYSLSRFDKDPERILDLQKNLDTTVAYLTRLRKLFPKTRIIMVESNHDKRLKKYLWTNASALSVLRCLDFNDLMGLNKLKIEYKKFFIYKKVLFKHGSIVRQHSGYTARAEMMKEGTSGSSGHTHCLGSHYKTLRGGKYVWVEGVVYVILSKQSI